MCIICIFVCKFYAKKMNTIFSIKLDKRKIKKNGKYPLKLRLYVSETKTQKLLKTGIDLTVEEYNNINSLRVKNGNKQLQLKCNQILQKANDISTNLKVWSIEAFELKFYNNSNTHHNIFKAYDVCFETLQNEKREGTYSSYYCSKKSILDFVNKKTKWTENTLNAMHITPQFLYDYERFMLYEKGNSLTTVGIYLRALKVVYNTIKADLDSNLYPFGRNKYVIPKGDNPKQAIKKKTVIEILNLKPKTPQQQKALDSWKMIFFLQGINAKDLLLFKNNQYDGEKITCKRQKTTRTNRSTKKDIVFISDEVRPIVNKYLNKDKSPESFLFSIREPNKNNEFDRTEIKKFTKFISQHMNTLLKNNNIDAKGNIQICRHSFATISRDNGATVEEISELMGHTDIRTTRRYLDSFSYESKQKIVNNIIKE